MKVGKVWERKSIIVLTMRKTKTEEPVSIIIPTFNEADYIGYLLFSLSRQTYKNFEVIVSDGSSKDKTQEVVAGFKRQLPSLKFVVFSKRSPVVQRNRGTREAQYELLLFLDADTILPPSFLKKNLEEIKKRKVDVAHPLSYPLTQKVRQQYYYLVSNWILNLSQKIIPLAGGWTIFSLKTFHQKIGGFDERLTKIADDTDYVMRIVKAGGRFGILKSCPPFVSVRRLDYEGIGGSIKNTLIQGIYFALFGKYGMQELIDRPYGHYSRLRDLLEKRKEKSSLLRRLTQKQFEELLAKIKDLLVGA